jgi:hypothetical protein
MPKKLKKTPNSPSPAPAGSESCCGCLRGLRAELCGKPARWHSKSLNIGFCIFCVTQERLASGDLIEIPNGEVSDGGGHQASESANEQHPPPFAPPKS